MALVVTLSIYMALCCIVYFIQEKLIFMPDKLPENHHFAFDQPFNEMFFKMEDGMLLNGVLFKADSSKGLIFYLHGNAGSIDGWGGVAKFYTDLHYDLFMLDYRGYGKSKGNISSEKQLYSDVQAVYDDLKKQYKENAIVILGYSIGTGPAAKLASTNNARLLVLQAPYYSLTDMMRHQFPILPTFLLKYKFETSRFLLQCKMPVVVFHGDADEVIYYGSSLKLKQLFKRQDTLITLKGGYHNGMSEREDYWNVFKEMINKD